MADITVPARPGAGDILTLGFGTTVAMWAVGYVCRLPPAIVPSWLLLALMLLCMLAGGVVAGRYASRGWKGGLYACLVAALLNLMILGSLLTSNQNPNQVVPSALWWIPGSFLVAALLGSGGAAVGAMFHDSARGPINWTVGFASVLGVATLLLLIIGGLVTGAEAGLAVVDWPNSFGYNMFLYPFSRMTGGVYYEHAHRLTGSLVGLTTLLLAIHLQRHDRRPWLKSFAWIALLTVIVQGILGGLRVTGRFTLSTSEADTAPSIVLAMVHGTLGQVFFGAVIAIVVFTSTAWQRQHATSRKPTARTDRVMNTVLVGLLVAQLVLGTILRHVAGGLHLHISMAVVVVLAAASSGVRAWGLYTTQPILQRLGRTLLVMIGVQVALGVAAYIAVGATAGIQPRPWVDVILTTVHQVVGALLLVCAVALMLWSYRLLAPEATTDVEPAARSVS